MSHLFYCDTKELKGFPLLDGNKTELFGFLSQKSMRHPQEYGKKLYATHGNYVLCSPAGLDLTNLAPCSMEEADTHLLLHVADAFLKGHRKIGIRAVKLTF